MRRLTKFGRAWRNYLYANCDGIHNDAEDFIIRVQLISDNKEELMDAMLMDSPDMILVDECKAEVAFQRVQLQEMINEFIEFCKDSNNYTISDVYDILTLDDILTDLCGEDIHNYLYEIAEEWKEWGEKVHTIWEVLKSNYGDSLINIHDSVCRLIMDEVYGEKPSVEEEKEQSFTNTALEDDLI